MPACKWRRSGQLTAGTGVRAPPLSAAPATAGPIRAGRWSSFVTGARMTYAFPSNPDQCRPLPRSRSCRPCLAAGITHATIALPRIVPKRPEHANRLSAAVRLQSATPLADWLC